MKISEIIKTNGKSLSFEFSPPETPGDEGRVLEHVKRLKAFQPSFISISQHTGSDTLERTMHMAGKLQAEDSLTIMPHITCANPDKKGLASVLEYYQKLGIENILAVRGESGEYGEDIFDGREHYSYASGLVGFIAGYNTFCIGVGVYPEGHPQSPNLGVDTSYTKKKIDQGAEFAISQVFFDNFYYYEMMDRFLQDGINIPVIAGIMPITDYQEVENYAEQGGIQIPVPVVTMFEELDDPEDVLKAGIDLATEQCLDLWENGVHCFHFFSCNRDEAVLHILDNLAPTLDQPL